MVADFLAHLIDDQIWQGWKTGLSDFDSFQNKNREGARPKDLKIKDVLRPEKILQGDKEPMEKNSKPKAEVVKIGRSDSRNWNVRFLQIRWSPSRV
jgi:hypothetical protein